MCFCNNVRTYVHSLQPTCGTFSIQVHTYPEVYALYCSTVIMYLQYVHVTSCYVCIMIQAHWFRVHLESLPTRAERCRFTAFLQHGCMTADVYDGDSLILLGVARIPLAVCDYNTVGISKISLALCNITMVRIMCYFKSI